jgi:hypothetical protein
MGRFYAHRAFSGDCHYCAINGDPAAVAAANEKASESGCLSIKPETIGHYLGNVYGGQ